MRDWYRQKPLRELSLPGCRKTDSVSMLLNQRRRDVAVRFRCLRGTISVNQLLLSTAMLIWSAKTSGILHTLMWLRNYWNIPSRRWNLRKYKRRIVKSTLLLRCAYNTWRIAPLSAFLLLLLVISLWIMRCDVPPGCPRYRTSTIVRRRSWGASLQIAVFGACWCHCKVLTKSIFKLLWKS